MAVQHLTIDSGFYVYVYRNPLKGGQPFYVGKGQGRRAYEHLTEKKSCNPHKCNTVQKIKAAGLVPVIEFSGLGMPERMALDLEVFLIRMWGRRRDGGILTNLTLGGEGLSGLEFSKEHKRKIGEANKIRVWSEESRRKNSESKKGRKIGRSAETIRKTADANRGRKNSDEAKRRMSEAAKNRKRSPFTEDHKRHISEGQKGRKCAPGARLALIEYNKTRAILKARKVA